MTSHAPPTFATHWMLPAWWVRAYETAVLSEADGDSAMRQALKAGFAPALGPFEMNALAVVIASLQEQLLAGERRLTIASSQHLKHAGTASRPKRLLFEKVIQNLCGMRILAPQPGDSAPRAYRLFAQDVWRVAPGRGGAEDADAPDGSDSVVCELTPSRLGFELVLGYGDAHHDLIRWAQGEATAAAILGAASPLALTRSLWLDLAGTDQLLLMRLERAMQWQFRWLQLEGVFGMPLGELFHGLPREGRDAREGKDDFRATREGRDALDGDLAQRLRALARLGRKLTAHGFLAVPQADCYLAVAETEERQLSLVWQLTRERLGSDAATSFRAAVAGCMRTHRYADFLEPLLRVFAPPAPSDEHLNRARAFWQRLAQVDAAPVDIGGLEHAPSQIIAPQALFFELCQRRRLERTSPGSPFPLPEALTAGPLGALTAAGDGADGEQFLAFCRLLDDSPDLLRALRDLPLATLTSEASRRVDGLAPYLSDLLAPAPERRAVTAKETATALIPEEPAEVDVGRTYAGDTAAGRRKGAVSGALASRMLRIASDELTRMRAAHPERYGELKRSYLSSLDDVGRRLILDVQKRMQTTVFEEHLRQRLVRFMVDNPGSWRSAEPPRREAGERLR